MACQLGGVGGDAPSMLLQPAIPRQQHPEGPTALTMSQLLDSHTQLEAARRGRDLSKMLKGVVTNMRCLVKFVREAGLTPYIGHAHYIYVCFLKSRISSRSPPSDCNLHRDMPKACALALSPSL